MRHGSVVQRHGRKCPRDESGKIVPHKCRGPWAFHVSAGRDANGRRRQITRSGFRTKKEAEAALETALAAETAGVADVHSLTVGAYLQQWLSGKRALRATTKRGYEIHIRLYIAPLVGTMRLADVRPHHVDGLYSDLLAAKDNRVTETTIRHIHATLRSALNTAVRRRLIPWNPALHVELPDRSSHRTSVWTPEQLGCFLDSIANHRLCAFFHLVAVAGLRRGEALGLAWSSVDFDAGVIRISQQLVDAGNGAYLAPPKTRSGVRAVPLDTLTLEVLREHRAAQEDERARWGQGWTDTGLVFTREDGTAFRPEYLTHLFRKLIAAAGLPRIRLHDLRHTSASLALAAGIPVKVVSARLGHSSTVITSDLYTHVIPAVGQDAADQIAALIPTNGRASRRASASLAQTDKPNREEA